MRHLRRSRLPALILGLVLGFAVLLPEIGHSLAHRHAAAHDAGHTTLAVDDHHDDAAAVAHAHGDVTSADTHAAGVHSHFDLRATPPTKASIAFALAAQTVVELAFDVAEPQRPSLIAQEHLVLAGRCHGPPPPSRAPPLS
jgi:hypothetical protein